MAKKKAAATGGAMGQQAKGLKSVQIWLTPEQHADLERAALVDGRPKTQVVIRSMVEGVKKILKKA